MDNDAVADTSADEFVEQAVGELPGLQPILDEHRDDYGEILPHVFFGDLTQFVVDHHLDPESDPSELDSLLALLDRQLVDGPEPVQELIAVSFVENLPYPDEEGADIVDRLGPALTAELKVQRADDSADSDDSAEVSEDDA